MKIMPLQSNNIPKKLLTIWKICDRIELRIEMEVIQCQITRFHLLLHIDSRLSVCIVLPSFRGNEKVKSSNSGSVPKNVRAPSITDLLFSARCEVRLCMKKILYTAVGVIAGASMALGAVASGALSTVVNRYDLNQDEEVNIKDLVNMMKYLTVYDSDIPSAPRMCMSIPMMRKKSIS